MYIHTDSTMGPDRSISLSSLHNESVTRRDETQLDRTDGWIMTGLVCLSQQDKQQISPAQNRDSGIFLNRSGFLSLSSCSCSFLCLALSFCTDSLLFFEAVFCYFFFFLHGVRFDSLWSNDLSCSRFGIASGYLGIWAMEDGWRTGQDRIGQARRWTLRYVLVKVHIIHIISYHVFIILYVCIYIEKHK